MNKNEGLETQELYLKIFKSKDREKMQRIDDIF